jgi:flagellar biosynthesis protein FlhB
MEKPQGQKTEPPSKKKLKRAREQGDVAVSRDLAGSLVVVVGCLVIFACGKQLISKLLDLFSHCFDQGIQNFNSAEHLGQKAISLVCWFIFIFGGTCVGIAFLSMASQVGLRFKLKFQWSRLNPIAGIKRMFSVQRVVDLGFMLVKLLVLGCVGWYVWSYGCIELMGRAPQDLGQLAMIAGQLLFRLIIGLGLVTIVIGGLDWWLQRKRYIKRMRMTKEEVMREHKEEDGDPAIKSERRRRHRQLLAGVGFSAISKSNVVVVNPTHIAIALSYNEESDEAPWIVASGSGSNAKKIRQEATRLGIPIIKHVPLARALIAVELGDEIPEGLYEAAAEVIRAIQQPH